MNDYLRQVSSTARGAASRGNWPAVDACAKEILKTDSASAEGNFLAGLVAKARQRKDDAAEAFARTIELDPERYDAAIELANLYSAARQNGAAAELVRRYEDKLANSPVYLNLAGNVYRAIGIPDKAWSLYKRANDLQPGVDVIEANLATASTFVGKIDEAREILKALLKRAPNHQRNHLSYARLDKAKDRKHIEQMQASLRQTALPPDRNVFMYYALGKEFEDLEEWDEAFKYFRMAGDAVTSVAGYDINTDLRLIDKIIDVCSAEWLRDGPVKAADDVYAKQPVFIVGLPRTGTTLTDRIISSHSLVQSAGETQFLQMVLKRESGVESDEKMTVEMIEATAGVSPQRIGDGYLDMLSYRLGPEPIFIDKLPFNILYLGYIAKAFPKARIVLVRRNPMDSCFAMYKQVFTWAYKFSYTLDGLGKFYIAYDRLLKHWKDILGDRLIDVEYEGLVADQESETRRLLERLGLDFEDACLNFDQSRTATTTASSVQVREKIHTRSVNRWKNYETQLEPLKRTLEQAGINID